MQTQGENLGRNFAKSSKTWQNHGNLKKQNTYFHSGVETSGEIS
jgi:hypothetical protein